MDIYDEEAAKIKEVGVDLNKKWQWLAKRLPPLPLQNEKARQAIQIWHDEAVARYHDAGWIVEVDITPALSGLMAPTVSVVDRVQKISGFDFDKKQYEVRKSRERGGK